MYYIGIALNLLVSVILRSSFSKITGVFISQFFIMDDSRKLTEFFASVVSKS